MSVNSNAMSDLHASQIHELKTAKKQEDSADFKYFRRMKEKTVLNRQKADYALIIGRLPIIENGRLSAD